MSTLSANGASEKRCTVCKRMKPVSEFYRDRSRPDGLYTKCKECHSKIVKKWQTKNADHFLRVHRRWRKANSEKEREYIKKYCASHLQAIHERAKKCRERHPGTSRNWRRNNKDKVRNYELTRRARQARNGGNMTPDEWNAVLEFYGHRCLCCGRDDVKLTIDHVLPIFLGGAHTVENVQPLCGPCNSSKGHKHIDYRKERFHATTRD